MSFCSPQTGIIVVAQSNITTMLCHTVVGWKLLMELAQSAIYPIYVVLALVHPNYDYFYSKSMYFFYYCRLAPTYLEGIFLELCKRTL